MRLTTRKFITFIKSLIFHIYWGFPKSTQEQIEYRFAICNDCDQLDTEHSECKVCGCNINNKRIFMNKLAWADQQCPLDKWLKLK